jgi:hypothetical protein
MLQSIIAAIVLFFAGIFGGPQVQLPPNVRSQPAAAVVALQNADPFGLPASSTNATSSLAATSVVNNYITQPVERVVESDLHAPRGAGAERLICSLFDTASFMRAYTGARDILPKFSPAYSAKLLLRGDS